MEPLFPSCTLAMSGSFSFSAFLGSEKLILVREEEEEDNKMGFWPGMVLARLLLIWYWCNG